MLSYLTPLLFALGATSSALPRRSNGPAVTIKNGTLIGQTNNVTDDFFAIPFAKPPVKDLRLRPPQSIDSNFGTLHLPTLSTSCLQQDQGRIDTAGLPNVTVEYLENLNSPFPGGQSEDCLTVNVQRPKGLSKDAKLPVLLWIFGGGFEEGTTSGYNGENLIATSTRLGMPVVYVAINYRVSALGFLGGKEVQKQGLSNLGSRDQRLAIEWVAENIAAFGGDPDKVTLWGESAGAVSVFTQLSLYNGNINHNGKPLFRGAIADSGSLYNSLPVDSAPAQSGFDSFVSQCGCSNATDSIACLRSVSTQTIQAAIDAQPKFWGYDGNNVPFALRADPSSDFNPNPGFDVLQHDSLAHLPSIWGNQEDEGTLFAIAQRNIGTTEDLIEYFTSYFPTASRETLAGLVDTYPDDPAAGSPYRTGDMYQLYPQYKRLAAINGDFTFSLTRRKTISHLSRKGVPVWSYLATYEHDLPYLGTSHISDIPETYGFAPHAEVGRKIDELYIRFVNFLDPNGGLKDQVWPRYDVHDRKLLNFSTGPLSILKDDFRQSSYKFIFDHYNELRF